MERRYKAFAATGSRSIGGYNRKVSRNERLPFLVVIIDELADLMMLAADEGGALRLPHCPDGPRHRHPHGHCHPAPFGGCGDRPD